MNPFDYFDFTQYKSFDSTQDRPRSVSLRSGSQSPVVRDQKNGVRSTLWPIRQLITLLFFFQSSFFLWAKLGFFLLLSFAFISFSLIAHISLSFPADCFYFLPCRRNPYRTGATRQQGNDPFCHRLQLYEFVELTQCFFDGNFGFGFIERFGVCNCLRRTSFVARAARLF